MKKSQDYLVNCLLSVFSVVIALIIGEMLLRIFCPHEQFASLYPNLSIEVDIERNIFPGVEDKFGVSNNEFGYRGSSYFDKNKFGILGIGASTTASLLIDDTKTWLFLLENKLKTSQPDSNSIIVGNTGYSGLTSGHHALQMEYMVPQEHYENVKIILMLVGINDYLRFLGMG